MALSQEFWLQKRRQEAKGLLKAAGCNPGAGGGAGPAAAAPWPGSGYAAAAAAKAEAAAACGVVASAGAAMAPWSLAGGVPAEHVAVTPVAAPNGGLRPVHSDAMSWGPVPAHVGGAAGSVLPQWSTSLPVPQPGIVPAFVVPGAPGAVLGEPAGHKDWNSDDEDIDEFGRKKRKAKGKDAPVRSLRRRQHGNDPSGADTATSSSSQAAESEPKSDTRSESKSEADMARKSSKNALSAKQQAALERLHGRSKKGQQAASGTSDSAVGQAVAAASAESSVESAFAVSAAFDALPTVAAEEQAAPCVAAPAILPPPQPMVPPNQPQLPQLDMSSVPAAMQHLQLPTGQMDVATEMAAMQPVQLAMGQMVPPAGWPTSQQWGSQVQWPHGPAAFQWQAHLQAQAQAQAQMQAHAASYAAAAAAAAAAAQAGTAAGITFAEASSYGDAVASMAMAGGGALAPVPLHLPIPSADFGAAQADAPNPSPVR